MARGSGFRVLVDGCTPMSSPPRELVGEVVPSPVVVAVEAPPLRSPPAAPRRGELTSSTCARPDPPHRSPLPPLARDGPAELCGTGRRSRSVSRIPALRSVEHRLTGK